MQLHINSLLFMQLKSINQKPWEWFNKGQIDKFGLFVLCSYQQKDKDWADDPIVKRFENVLSKRGFSENLMVKKVCNIQNRENQSSKNKVMEMIRDFYEEDLDFYLVFISGHGSKDCNTLKFYNHVGMKQMFDLGIFLDYWQPIRIKHLAIFIESCYLESMGKLCMEEFKHLTTVNLFTASQNSTYTVNTKDGFSLFRFMINEKIDLQKWKNKESMNEQEKKQFFEMAQKYETDKQFLSIINCSEMIQLFIAFYQFSIDALNKENWEFHNKMRSQKSRALQDQNLKEYSQLGEKQNNKWKEDWQKNPNKKQLQPFSSYRQQKVIHYRYAIPLSTMQHETKYNGAIWYKNEAKQFYYEGQFKISKDQQSHCRDYNLNYYKIIPHGRGRLCYSYRNEYLDQVILKIYDGDFADNYIQGLQLKYQKQVRDNKIYTYKTQLTTKPYYKNRRNAQLPFLSITKDHDKTNHFKFEAKIQHQTKSFRKDLKYPIGHFDPQYGGNVSRQKYEGLVEKKWDKKKFSVLKFMFIQKDENNIEWQTQLTKTAPKKEQNFSKTYKKRYPISFIPPGYELGFDLLTLTDDTDNDQKFEYYYRYFVQKIIELVKVEVKIEEEDLIKLERQQQRMMEREQEEQRQEGDSDSDMPEWRFCRPKYD